MNVKNENQTIYSQPYSLRALNLFWLPVSAIFFQGGINLVKNTHPIGYLSLIFGLVIIYYVLKRLIYPNNIIATEDGLEIRKSLKSIAISWDRISKFEVYKAPLNWLSVFVPQGSYLSPSLIMYFDDSAISVYRGHKAEKLSRRLNDIKTLSSNNSQKPGGHF